MVTAFRTNEVSSEILLKSFLREIFLDDEIASLIARHLAEKGIEERGRIIGGLSGGSNIHRSHWDERIKTFTKK